MAISPAKIRPKLDRSTASRGALLKAKKTSICAAGLPARRCGNSGFPATPPASAGVTVILDYGFSPGTFGAEKYRPGQLASAGS